ncbi:MAG TPA: hypothetical protein VF026_11750 [Ktedonobacteraceae bacterium]
MRPAPDPPLSVDPPTAAHRRHLGDGVPRTASQPGMRSNREEICHLLAADFPRHSGYTERCWTQSGAHHPPDGVCVPPDHVQGKEHGQDAALLS